MGKERRRVLLSNWCMMCAKLQTVGPWLLLTTLGNSRE
jgi:hypothetical protein